MPNTLVTGLKTVDWATDSTQSFVTSSNDNAVITDKFMQEKITLDGKKDSQSNFDFIQNKVVDGLVYTNLSKTTGTSINTNTLLDSGDFVIQSKFEYTTTGICFLFGNTVSGNGFKVHTHTNNELRLTINDTVVLSTNFIISIGIPFDVVLSRAGSLYTLYVNQSGRSYSGNLSASYVAQSRTVRFNDYGAGGTNPLLTYVCGVIYNRTLSPQEINHNFNVLNNTSSTSQLTVTDSTGTKMPLLFASDTSHVEGRGGVLQDQINADFYKQFCKEFTSDGSDITVTNGMRGYVNSFNMSGQTVKNVMKQELIGSTQEITGTNYRSYNCTNTLRDFLISKGGLQLQPNTKYTLIVDVIENTLDVPVLVIGTTNSAIAGSTPIFTAGQTGIFKCVITTKPNFDTILYDFWLNYTGSAGNKSLKMSVTLIEGEQISKVSSYIPFGLSSTKASIANNGIKYNFYGLDSNVITLGGVNGVYDTLTLNDDGSGTLVQNTKEVVLNGSENWVISGVPNQSITIAFTLDVTINPIISQAIISNIFKYDTWASFATTDLEFISNANDRNRIGVRILKTKLTTPDINGFKAWLASNPVTVRYQLATPITTTIPKEKMTTVLTADKSNILACGDGVKASSFSVNVPTNEMIKRDYAITLLNGYTAIVGSFNPRLSLRNDNKVELSLDLMSASTYNPTILSLPVELRPKTDVKLTGFVDNIATPIIVKKTGEVQVPNSIVSKSVYVKDTYRLV